MSYAPRCRIGTSLLAAALLMGAAGAAPAQQVARVNFMPDFDQGRDGLPGDGNLHCAPTAAVNLMAYIANHGFPQMMDGPRDWQSQAQHDFVSGNIFIMGILMGTTDAGGTSSGGAETGLRAWVDGHAPGLFTVTRVYATEGAHAVNPYLLFYLLSDGSLATVGYGRYARPFKFEPEYERRIGHVVTPNRVLIPDLPGDDILMAYRDPATADGDLTQQSLFSTRSVSLRPDTIPLVSGESRTMWEMFFSPPMTPGTRRFIDSILIVDPAFALTVNGVLAEIHRPLRLGGSSAPPVREFQPPAGQFIAAADLFPDQRSALVAATAGGGAPLHLWHLNLHTGEYDQLDADARGPFAISRHAGEIYYPLPDGTLARWIMIGGDGGPDDDRILEPRDFQLPPAPIAAMAYDDDRDEVLALAPAAPELYVYSRTLGDPLFFRMNADVTLQPPISLHLGPAGSPIADKVVVRARQNIHVFRRTPDTLDLESSLTITDGTVTGVSITDIGTLVVARGGSTVEYCYDPADAGWHPCPDSFLTGLAATRTVSISRSRTNYDARLHSGPGWAEVIDDEVTGVGERPDCAADFNHDTFVNSQDFFDFLGAFFALELRADFNADGAINSQDFFDFLAAFFAC